ncbi:MAG: hypothetical protein FWC91_12985 [Defluviitaleaceae bacterium]|nr:hypothetical protein [Defluviitaleaceae bacterium]
MNKMYSVIIAMIASPVIVFLLIWGGAMIVTETLTYRYGHIFEEAISESQDIQSRVGGMGYLKVLHYSDTFARIYRVWVNQENSRHNHVEIGGAVFYFSKEGDVWQLTGQGTTWSRVGSADGIIWPYFYHSAEGIILFIVIAIFTLIIVIILIVLYLHFSSKSYGGINKNSAKARES